MALISVDEALERLLEMTQPLEYQMTALNVLGRRQVLAENIVAKLTQPPFNASAMDGYALAIKDGENLLDNFKCVGKSIAGKSYDGKIAKGEAIRIFTGAPVPQDATTIIMQENVSLHDNNMISLHEPPKINQNIRPKGGDFSEGDVVLKKGKVLSPAATALCAASGHAKVAVIRRPLIAILATGDELVSPDESRGEDQIICSNSYGLAQIIKNHDCDIIDLGIAKDNKESIAQAIFKAKEAKADLLLTIGGVSVGEYDLVQESLKAEGMQLNFWKIAMRPGKPLMFGTLPTQNTQQKMLVLGLPGNPVSSLVCAQLFLIPILEKLSGRNYQPKIATAILTEDLFKNGNRRHYIRAKYNKNDDGKMLVTPFNNQDSSLIHLLADANCLIIQEINAPAQTKGDKCTIFIPNDIGL